MRRFRSSRTGRRSLLAAAAMTAVAVPAASAATIPVTTGDDRVADDGATSLREALALAAAAPGADVVTLPAGVHALADCEAGPATYAGAGRLELRGAAAAVRQMCAGSGVLRVAPGAGAVTVTGPDLVGPGGSGAPAVQAAGRLRLLDVAVRAASGAGVRCDDCRYLEILRSRIEGNGAGGVRVVAAAGMRMVVAETVVSGNRLAGRGAGVSLTAGDTTGAPPRAVIGRSEVSGNVAMGPGSGGGGVATTGVDLRIDDSRVSGNAAGDGEWPADGGGVLVVSGYPDREADLVVSGSVVAGNTASASGGGLAVSGTGSAQIDTSWIDGNAAGADGGGVDADLVTADAALAVISSTLSRNTAGADARGGGLRLAGTGLLGVSTSTLTENAAGHGGGIQLDGAVLAEVGRSTLAGNAAPDGAALQAGPDVAVVLAQSIVALPVGGPLCRFAAPSAVASLGYSFLGEADCAPGPLDRVSVADPLLGPLTEGDEGETPVRVPAPASPAAGIMPAPLCADDEDQRGVPRVQGAACDAGAVEIVEASAG